MGFTGRGGALSNDGFAMAPDSDRPKLRVCVLHSSYEGVKSETAGLDPYCVPHEYDKDHRYEWEQAFIQKQSAVAQIRDLSRQGFDVFLNLCDGAYDEERAGKEVVDALEKFKCTYTGADSIFFEPSKELMKMMAYYYSIPTAQWTFIYDVDMQDDAAALDQVTDAVEGLRYPLIVKHHNGYASVGMGRDSKVCSPEQLVQQVRKFVGLYGGALVEEFISGREFTVLVVENSADPAQPHVLEPVECQFSQGEEFKHFDLKWIDYGTIQWTRLPEGESVLRAALQTAARGAFVALKGCSYGRCDFRVDAQGNVFFLEINPQCGVFYSASEMGSADYILTQDPGVDHAKFLDMIIGAAQARAENKRQDKAVEVRFKAKCGYGLYATRDLPQGTIAAKYEERDHVLVSKGYAVKQFPEGSLQRAWFDAYAFPVTDEVWVTWSEDPFKWQPLNHSCDPNCWFEGLDLVTRRPVKKGEQITCDYATFCTDNMTAFDCSCGAASCRSRVTGQDYLQPWIDNAYGGHVSDYVATKRRAHLAKLDGLAS